MLWPGLDQAIKNVAKWDSQCQAETMHHMLLLCIHGFGLLSNAYSFILSYLLVKDNHFMLFLYQGTRSQPYVTLR